MAIETKWPRIPEIITLSGSKFYMMYVETERAPSPIA